MADATESAPALGVPPPAEVGGWAGWELDDSGGAPAGRVHTAYVDSTTGEPAWLIVGFERGGLLPLRRRATLVALPLRDCAGAAGRVWTAHAREALHAAPAVDPTRPLLREHELAICAHYGIGDGVGRAAEVVGRPAGSVTSQPVAV
jgi:hypothetical protein